MNRDPIRKHSVRGQLEFVQANSGRKDLLDLFNRMVTEDFGKPNVNGVVHPLCPHCQAHLAVLTLIALYEDLEAEEEAQRIIEAHQPKNRTGTRTH